MTADAVPYKEVLVIEGEDRSGPAIHEATRRIKTLQERIEALKADTFRPVGAADPLPARPTREPLDKPALSALWDADMGADGYGGLLSAEVVE